MPIDIDVTRSNPTVSVNVIRGDDSTVAEAATLNGVTVTGTPEDGQVLTATSATTATWEDPTGGSGGTAGLTPLDALTISSAGTTTISSGNFWKSIAVTTNGTVNIVLDTTGRTSGDLAEILLSISEAASGGTVNFRNGSASGTILDTYTADGTAAGNHLFFIFQGGAWKRRGANLTYVESDAVAIADVTGLQTALDAKLASATAASTYQPLDSDLTAIAALTTTTFGRSLLTQADASATRSTLGLVIGTNVQAYSATLAAVAGGTYTGATSITTLGTITTGNAATSWEITNNGATGGTLILHAGTSGTHSKIRAGAVTTQRTLTTPDRDGEIATVDGPLGTPSSGTVTNLTGTASININGTVGATTPAAGSFTTLSASTSLTLGTSGILVGGTNAVGQRNGTSAQLFQVFNTYTSGSVNEYAYIGWATNKATFGVFHTGATQRVMQLLASSFEIATGTTNRWTINSSGHILGAADNTYDIGASGATRPRNVYVGTLVRSPKYETAASVHWTSGTGSPESVVTANVGSLYTRTDGGASTTLYVKESGTGNTGWVAK